MVHSIVQLQALVRTGCFLIQQLRRRRTGHSICRPMHRQKRRRHLGEIILYVLAHPSQFPHRPHPRLPRVPSGIRGDDLQLLRILDGLPHHLVVGHCRPRVGDPEQHTVQEQPHLAGLHVLGHDEQRRREDQPRPRVGIGLEVHQHGGRPTHGLPEQKSGEVLVRFAAADVDEVGERGGGDALQVAEVASETVGATVTEEVGGEDGVTPVGEADADLLEEPASVGAVAVGHVDGAFDTWRVQGDETLGEELAAGGVEVGFGVSNPLGGVVLLFRHEAPEIRGRFGWRRFGLHDFSVGELTGLERWEGGKRER